MANSDGQSRTGQAIMPEPFQRKDRSGWWYWYRDADGKWRRKKGGATKAEAWACVVAKERELQPVRLGLIDARTFKQQQYAQQPIQDVIKQFEASLRGKKRSEIHIRGVIADICTVFGVSDPDKERQARRDAAKGYKPRACNWTCLSDAEASEFERFLSDVSSVLSAVRRNRYRTSVFQLINWSVKRGWLPHNPLIVVPKLNEEKDRRRVRRALDEDEVWRLIDETHKQGRRGVYRSLYYWMAFKVGLRWSEINRLRADHIDLGDDPCLILDGSVTKNGSGAILPIPDDLAEALRDGLGHSQVLFKTKPDRRTWRSDLRRAGIDFETVEGCAYRGATRTTFATHLYRAGVDLRTAQELMRHSDPKLTAKVYQRVRLVDTRPAIDKLNRPKKHTIKSIA